MKVRLLTAVAGLLVMFALECPAVAGGRLGRLPALPARLIGAGMRQTRETAGLGAVIVTELHPGIRLADGLGLIDRRRIVRTIRGH